MQTQKPFWITAHELILRTGLDPERLRKIRKDNPTFYKLFDSGGYRYDANKIPELLKIKTESYA